MKAALLTTSPLSVGKSGSLVKASASNWLRCFRASASNHSIWSLTMHAGQAGCLGPLPHMHWCALQAPRAEMSVLDTGSRMRATRVPLDMSSLTCPTRMLEASISLRSHQEAVKTALCGQTGPPATNGAGDLESSASLPKGMGLACFAGPLPRLAARAARAHEIIVESVMTRPDATLCCLARCMYDSALR
jgi:hypothetical protein